MSDMKNMKALFRKMIAWILFFHLNILKNWSKKC